jgi:hypothetical protein
MGHLALPERRFLVPSLPVFVLLSILWTAWLPTYASFRRAELQGRKVRVRGRERYIVSSFFLVQGDLIANAVGSIDIAGRSVVVENVHGKPHYGVWAPSFHGLSVPALQLCLDWRPHLLLLCIMLRTIRK